MSPRDLESLQHSLSQVQVHRVSGHLLNAVGPLLEAVIPGVSIGGLCEVGNGVLAEVVGFREDRTLLMPLGQVEGVSFGARVRSRADTITVPVGEELLGRVLDGLGRPIDNKGPIFTKDRRQVANLAPAALERDLISEPIFTGVRAIDGLITLGKGQRVAIIAGSGVGKSTLLGMITRSVTADVAVVCLVGERGREVREFLEFNLGEEGLARAVVVAVTSEQSPAMQIKGAFLATTLAEYFRDQGRDVLLMMDSLTRLSMAQRQIGLSAGEPPTTRGYTPSVFAQLPRLLERAGPGTNGGSITGIYTVLVEADDTNDPIADAVRGIVDGHIILSRRLASHGHYPAIDALSSLSRLMSRVASPPHREAATKVRNLLATWSENEELIRLGAYRKGTDPSVDAAIDAHPAIQGFLQQDVDQPSPEAETLGGLQALVATPRLPRG
ncbi:MAG: FliI/YscN family ATPase [Deltaproteobacteria bacterium]|nr:FliI/YscN family ATPase [Deltaproteobacteria bacterium]